MNVDPSFCLTWSYRKSSRSAKECVEAAEMSIISIARSVDNKLLQDAVNAYDAVSKVSNITENEVYDEKASIFKLVEAAKQTVITVARSVDNSVLKSAVNVYDLAHDVVTNMDRFSNVLQLDDQRES